VRRSDRSTRSTARPPRTGLQVGEATLWIPGSGVRRPASLWLLLTVFALAFAGVQGALTFIGIRIVELAVSVDVALSLAWPPWPRSGLVAAGCWVAGSGSAGSSRLARAVRPVHHVVGVLPFVVAINATRVVTGLCNGSLMAARVLMVPRLLPRSLQATGQVLFQAATLGFGTVMAASSWRGLRLVRTDVLLAAAGGWRSRWLRACSSLRVRSAPDDGPSLDSVRAERASAI